jgi:hypothetical protein
MNARLHELLQESLVQLEAGKNVQEILAAHPDVRDELEPLLTTAAFLSQGGIPEPDPDAIIRNRARMLSRAAELRDPRQDFKALTLLPRYAVGFAAAIFILVLSGYSLFSASAQALPGDLLYPVKRSAESLQLGITINIDDRKILEDKFEERRTEEVIQLLAESRVEFISFEGKVEYQRIQDWIVGGINVHLNEKTRMIGSIQVEDEIEVEGETQPEGYVLAHELHKRTATIQGIVNIISSDLWQIDGQNVTITEQSDIKDGVSVGDKVSALVVVNDDSSFVLLEVILLEDNGVSPAQTEDIDEEDHDMYEFYGEVDTIDVNVWIVEGQELRINSDTDIDDGIEVGDIVSVKAELRAGDIWAVDIDLLDEGNDASETSEDEDSELLEEEDAEENEVSEEDSSEHDDSDDGSDSESDDTREEGDDPDDEEKPDRDDD